MRIYKQEEIFSNCIKINNCQGIYFLIRNNKIIYIGESNNVYERIQGWYRRQKISWKKNNQINNFLFENFDSYFVHILPNSNQDERRTLEAIYILIYKPQYNSDIPLMNRNILNKYLPTIKKTYGKLEILLDNG